MKSRFLLHKISHTILMIDISEIGMDAKVNPRTGNTKMVPSLRFPVWKEAEQYLRRKGADSEALEVAGAALRKTGLAALTIV